MSHVLILGPRIKSLPGRTDRTAARSNKAFTVEKPLSVFQFVIDKGDGHRGKRRVEIKPRVEAIFVDPQLGVPGMR